MLHVMAKPTRNYGHSFNHYNQRKTSESSQHLAFGGALVGSLVVGLLIGVVASVGLGLLGVLDLLQCGLSSNIGGLGQSLLLELQSKINYDCKDH